MKRVLIAVGCLALAVIMFVVLFPTVLTASEGGFEPQEVLSARSSDGRLHVIVTKRVAFPTFDFIDPSVVIEAQLSDLATDEIVASARVVLFEDSDYSPANVQWQSGEVRITGFDRSTNQVMVLRPARRGGS